MSNKLWIVGQAFDEKGWDFQGVFSTREKAVAACKTERFFICSCSLDVELPVETSFMGPEEDFCWPLLSKE